MRQAVVTRTALLWGLAWASSGFAAEAPIVKVANAIRQAQGAWSTSPEEGAAEPARAQAEANMLEALRAIEVQNRKREAEFAAATVNDLPQKAIDRLEAARAAYAASYGRLADILRQLVADPKPETLEAARPGLLAEAAQILARLEASSSKKPISQTLPVNSPPQEAPPIGVPSGSISTVPIGAIPATLQEAADALPGVPEIYEAVRNGTAAEFYFGVMKGAAETYREGSGNDADTASTLAQMIRAKGIPARYVRGVVELNAPAFMAMTGAATIEQAVRVFERAGIPHEAVLGAGSVASVKFDRVWVEAYVPYANYRGSMLDGQGKVWIPLDAGFKSLEPPRGTDPSALGFDASAVVTDYLSAVQTGTPLDFIKGRVTALAAAAGLSYSDLLNSRRHASQVSGLLPNSLPYRVVSITERSYDLPDSLHHTLRLVGTLNGQTIIDFTTQTKQVVGKRFTLGYAPSSDEETQLVASHGGLLRTPPYLVEVTPTISIGGVTAYAGSAVAMGVPFELHLEVASPGGMSVIENQVQAGNVMALGLGGAVQAQGLEEDVSAAQILSGLALRYFSSWNEADRELANLLHVIPVRPTVSVCLVSSDIDVEYADGDPLLPVGWEWKGLLIDADLRATSPVGVVDQESEKRFIQLSGLQGSILENKVFEDAYQIASVSTAKALGIAASEGIPVLDITSANIDLINGLPFDSEVKAEVLDAAQRGRRVSIPSMPVTYLAWTGVGYLIQDDVTLAAAYQLQGGHSGGVTAPAVLELPALFVDRFQDPLGEPVVGDPDVVVASIQIVPSRNFQIGTVNMLANEPLRVFVTDGNGFPLKDATVTFQVIGGGGALKDPVTNTSVPVLYVKSDQYGYADAPFIFGRRTDLIPRFLAPSEGLEHSTQVGLNLVTASAGLVRLDEPFTLFGAPDERRDASNNAHVTVSLKVAHGAGWLANLKVAGRMDISVEDQWGNPISNVPIRVSSRVAEPGEKPGVRAPIADYGGVLNQTDYARCTALVPTLFKGECRGQDGSPGEQVSLVIPSSDLGVFAFVAMGASTGSFYVFDFGTEATPNVGWAAYPTVGTVCVEGDCNLLKTPIAYTSAGTRGIYRNSAGDEVEAYVPGTPALMTFFTDVVREKERVVLRDGKYYVEGINEWVRERLDGSTVKLTATTPGTGVPGTATPVDGAPGLYLAPVTMAPTPQRNAVEYEVKAYAPRPRLTPDGDVPAQYVDQANMKLTPEGWWQDPAKPSITRSTFGLWGVSAEIQSLAPSPIVVTRGGLVAEASKLLSRIEPPEYRALLAPSGVSFEVNRLDPPLSPGGPPTQTAILSGVGVDEFTVPAGLALQPADYRSVLRVPGVAFTAPFKDIVSQPLDTAACELVSLKRKEIVLNLVRDPLNGTFCGAESQVAFTVCRDARVTLKVDGLVVTGGLDGSPSGTPILDLPLSAGEHMVSLSSALLGQTLGRSAPLVVKATALSNPSVQGEDTGRVINEIENQSSLPVGHTFVKGVDLFDGHLVQQATDLSARGRHLGLEVTRTYSSAGRDGEGLLGAGWTFNYESRVFATSCAVVVRTADGGSQAFTPLADGGLQAQKGYHAKLRQNSDGSYDFIDKAGVVHHFREPEDASRPTGPRRLDWIREPHGDELRFGYDDFGRLQTVGEWHPEAAEPVRSLHVTYVQAKEEKTGLDRIKHLEIQPHGTTADFGYDDFGNLTSATTSTGLSWIYGYTATDERDRHQLVSVVDPNGARMETSYFGRLDPFPGEQLQKDGVLVVLSKEEFVKRVREFPQKGSTNQTAETQFLYDYTGALGGTYRTSVADPRNHETKYTSNSNGSVTLIEEPENRNTVITWKPADILKATETDPNQRLTEYDYDANGNQILERVHAPGIGLVDTVHEYEPAFNRVILSRDGEGRETRYEIDPGNGDVLSVTDALLNKTINAYDEHGQMLSTRDPRGNVTQYRDHTSYGDAREMEDALGNLTARVFDARGRLTDETDTMGRSRTLTYDEQDRVLSQLRRAGGSPANLDEATARTYYPMGQILTETTANGGDTTYVLDGMNRVVETVTPSGSISTQWNDDGTKRTELDRRGVRKTFSYDDAHRLKTVTLAPPALSTEGPVGEIAYFEYDGVGNKTLERDFGRRTTQYEYDGLYRVKRKVLPLAPFDEKYAYDKVGNRLSARDANGHETRMAYDALNRVTSVRRDPDGLNLTTLTEYNDPGAYASHVNKSAEIDVTRGLRTEFAYDEINRETERRVILQGEDGDPATSNVTYSTVNTYADARHAVTVKDPNGNETEIRMDGLDRVVGQAVLGVCAAGQPLCAPGTPADLLTEMAYDGLGNKVKQTDSAGRVKSWLYDEQGRLKSATDFAGTITYGYDGEGLKISEKDRRGIERAFTYDNLGRPRAERLVATPLSAVAWSRETRYLDTPNDWRRVERDARGNETLVHLDALGREIKTVDPYGYFTETKWDGVNKREMKDKNQNTTLMEYDAVDRLVVTTDPAPFGGQTVETSYDDPNNRKTEKDRRGKLTVAQSDALGRVVRVTRSGVRLERNAYDGNSNKILGEDAEGKKTTFAYDRANRLVARTDGAESLDAAATRFVMDGSGNKTAEIDPRSTEAEPSMRYAYDGASRQTDVFNGEGDQTHIEYDGEGNRISVTPPAQPATTYQWDELGKLLSVTQPATADHGRAVTAFGYDENRNKASQTNANGFTTTYVYDKLNRLEKRFEPAALPAGPLVTAFAYDPNGNVTLTTDPKLQTEAGTYDELNRKTKVVYGEAPGTPSTAWREVRETRFNYDENNNPTGAHEFVTSGSDPPVERTITRAFDDLDRLEMETTTLPDGGTKTITYEYFDNGTRKALIDAQGLRTEYSYDGKNRVQTMVTEAGTADAKATTYGYYADDLLKETLDPSGVKAERVYDKADRLKILTNATPTATVSRYDYAYDPNGNRISQTEALSAPGAPLPLSVSTGPPGPPTNLYTYDEANRLKSVSYAPDATYPFGRVVTYHYDKVGNREREVEALPEIIPAEPSLQGAIIIERIGTFDANNRLTTLATVAAPPTVPPSYIPESVPPAEAGAHSSSTLVIGYDPNGNETSRTRTLTAADGGTVTTTLSTYDLKDHLVEQTKDGSIIARHEYDADGRRTKKIGEEGIRQYVYDDTSLLAEYDTNGLEVAKYDYGADRLIRLTRADEGMRYMSFDGLGSVTGLTDTAGDVTATYHLDAWGNYRFTRELATSHNRFGFTGHYWDKEASLYYAKARYYDPFTARFTQADSFLGTIDDPPSLHRYLYANDNPTVYVDPDGHMPHLVVTTATGALIGAGYSLIHQTLAVAEGSQNGFEWDQFGDSVAKGAAVGLGVGLLPLVLSAEVASGVTSFAGYSLSGVSIVNGATDVMYGNRPLTGAFDVGAGLLGIGATWKAGSAAPVEVQEPRGSGINLASPKASATTNTEAGRAAAERAAARQAARIEAAQDEALIENQRRNDPFRIGLGRNSSPAFERGPSGVTPPAPNTGIRALIGPAGDPGGFTLRNVSPQQHHTVPKYTGGIEAQAKAPLPGWEHRSFHEVLDNSGTDLPFRTPFLGFENPRSSANGPVRLWGRENAGIREFAKVSPANRRYIVDHLRKTYQEFGIYDKVKDQFESEAAQFIRGKYSR